MRIDKKHLVPALAALLVFILAVATTELIVWLTRQQQLEQQRTDILLETAAVRARLEGEINSTLYLTRGLIAYVATHPMVDPDEFSILASEIIATGRSVRNIGLAQNNVITHIYPLAGNEAALGLEYEKVPSQWPAVQKAIEMKGTVVAGPVELAQGGHALIARTPIYTRPGISGFLDGNRPRYWGLASIVIDIPPLFQAAAFAEQIDGTRFALRGKDGLGEAGDMILGDPAIFEANPVLTPVSLPNGSWQLAAMPVGGWGVGLGPLWGVRLAGWAIALLLGYLLGALLWTREVNRTLALQDELTGLPNRRLFEDRIERIIAASARDGDRFGVLFVDLDGFKQINDAHGHRVGDGFLREVARRMLASVRACDTVARTGGDEFIVLATGIDHPRHLAEFRQRLEHSFSMPAVIEGRQIEIRASIGAAFYPQDGESAEVLLATADQRMYSEKPGPSNVRSLDSVARTRDRRAPDQ